MSRKQRNEQASRVRKRVKKLNLVEKRRLFNELLAFLFPTGSIFSKEQFHGNIKWKPADARTDTVAQSLRPGRGSGAFLVESCRQLGDELIKAWYSHNLVPKDIPPDEDEVLHARRLIAQHCLYGVDKNPMAVDLSKLSLWLATLAKDHPFTFLDHSLRAGDSLVGLTREQIVNFTWESVAPGTGLARKKKSTKRSAASLPATSLTPQSLFSDPIAEQMRTVTEYRQRILASRDDKPYEQLRQELDVADEALSLARLTGDCVIAAYFSASKDRERVAKLDTLARQLVQYIGPTWINRNEFDRAGGYPLGWSRIYL